MAENRDAQIMVNMEPTLCDLVRKLADKNGVSSSGYVRQLIISDLMKQGLMTQSILEAILLGRRK